MKTSLARIALLAALAALVPAAAAQASNVPVSTGYVTDGNVLATAIDSSGRTYLGGTFTQVNALVNNGMKLTSASDRPPSRYSNVNDAVNAVASDGSGGWYIGGA